MRRILVVAFLLAFPANAEALSVERGKRAVSTYTAHLQRDYKPAGVTWHDRWVEVCGHPQSHSGGVSCGYGLDGTRRGKPYFCAGVADVFPRRRPGRRYGWRDVQPIDIVVSRLFRIVPELFFECWGPESRTIRVSPAAAR